MKAEGGARIGLVGATGALGEELTRALGSSSLRVRELVPIATERSLGRDVELRDEIYPVLAEAPPLRGLDLLILAAPAAASLEFARLALRSEVPCLDLSGALAETPEVPLCVALGDAGDGPAAPLLTAPPGPALAWTLALRPLARAAGLRRLIGTLLEGASGAGREGIEALHEQSVALFTQQDAPEAGVFPRPVAFDCLPDAGGLDAEGRSERERNLERLLPRLLGGEPRISVTAVQVPAFAGHAAALHLETERPLDPKQAEEALARADGVELWSEEPGGLTLRSAAGRDVVLVGRVRRDASAAAPERALALWLVADTLRLAAANAVRLAAALLRRG